MNIVVPALVLASLLTSCSKETTSGERASGRIQKPAATTERLPALPSSASVPVLSPAAGPSVPTTTASSPGKKAEYALYLLALTWGPSFCCDAEHQGKEQCKGLEKSFAADHLTLHGLWPSYDDQQVAEHRKVGGKENWPQFCAPYDVCAKGEASSCNPDPGSIPPDMKTYGPGYVTDHEFLANHEWPKHGSCTGLDSATFFKESVKALLTLPGDRGTPKTLSDNIGKSVKATELRASFGQPESVVLSCDKHCGLSQVGICFENRDNGLPGARVACPKNVTEGDYDNGCFVNDRCPNITLQAANQCAVHECRSPGQGPACQGDDGCKSQGFVRCAKSGCCTNVPK
jgi:ribonuclease T2